MSGRSAYVRKKITQTKDKSVPGTRSRAATSSSLDADDAMFSDFPVPQGPVGTGVGTTNARFLKFSDPAQGPLVHTLDAYHHHAHQHMGSMGSMGPIGMNPMSHMNPVNAMVPVNHAMRPSSPPSVHSGSGSSEDYRHGTDEYGFSRMRRSTVKTDEVSGIEKSGFRSILDRKSDDVRRGLAKTFAFRGKPPSSGSGPKSPDLRSDSVATIRGPHNMYTPPYHSPMSPTANMPAFNHDQFPYSPESITSNGRMHHIQNISPQAVPSPSEMWDQMPAAAPPMGKLPPVPQNATNTPPIKRWIGFGRPVQQRWNKLRRDPELWDTNGDVFVYLSHRSAVNRPPPSFRLSSHIIEATESRFLLALLREGSTEEDYSVSPSPGHRGRQGSVPYHNMGRNGQPTPPVSDDTSVAEAEGQISYEIFFPTPNNLNKIEQLRHQITTRNLFATLCHASLVGVSMFQALSDLQGRMEMYMPPDTDNIGTIINYILARGIDDVRNDVETAVGLLAWSEKNEVRWDEGWKESFIHCAGMYGPHLEQAADYSQVTQISRALLDRASLETQVRVQQAEERLAEFQYADMWPLSAPTFNGVANQAFDRLQKFLITHYTRVYGTWPPPTPNRRQSNTSDSADSMDWFSDGMWLTRTVAQSLQRDFGSLYDYLVNRDIVWDESEMRSTRKWMMVSESGNKGFDADESDVPMTDMLVDFDNRNRYPHIPHPYPLVPESIPPPVPAAPAKEATGMFKTGKKTAAPAAAPTGRAGHMERRVRLAYTESTNISILGSDFAQSDLVDAFVKLERQDKICEIDPAIARRGRWVLIYGVLQTLASVSVDSPWVQHHAEVPYHMSPRLKGAKLPPWNPNATSHETHSMGKPPYEEACHELSYCWLIPRSWDAPGAADAPDSEDSGRASPLSDPRGATSRSASRQGGGSGSGSGPSASTAYAQSLGHPGFLQSGSRSARSTVSSLPMGASASVMGDGDSLAGYPMAAAGHGAGRATGRAAVQRMRSRENIKMSSAPSMRSAATFGVAAGYDGASEYGSAVSVSPRRTMWSDAGSVQGGYGYGRSSSVSSASASASVGMAQGPGQGKLAPPGMAVYGAGDDVETRSNAGSFRTTVSANGTVIRDFDALDVIDDHEP